jgi:putative MFS transporter
MPIRTEDPARRSAAAAVSAGAESDLLSRIESVPFSWWHTKARVVMGSATFFDAFNALSLAFALPILIRLWHISPRQVGEIISSGYLGQLIGALWFGWLAEKAGRVRSATGAVALMSVMNLACMAAGGFNVLLACRFVQGIGVGGEMPVAAAYISELSGAHGRGRFFLLYEMIFPIGLMVTGQLGAWLVPVWGWKSMFLVGAVPGLLITPLVARLPESPRWLIAKGRLADAERVVEQIEASTSRRISVAAPPASGRAGVVGGGARPAIANGTLSAQWREVLSRFYRGRTLIVWALWASAYFITNSLNNWMPSLYSTAYHLSLRSALRAASLTNVAQVAILLVCAFCIDRVGRRKWTIVSFVLGGALLAVLGLSRSPTVTLVIVLATLSYGIIGSVNAVLYLYTPEIYPTRIRAAGTGLATSWLRLASAVGPALIGVMVATRGLSSVFLLFVGISALGAVAATGMIETRNRRLEELAP